MTTPFLPLPVFRAFDSGGLPLAGGQLFSYAAGTTTPQATYSDAAGVTPNANPVILDSTGTAVVRLGVLGYKFVLKDSGGATQWTEDNYIALSGDSPTFLGTVTANALVSTTSITAASLAISGNSTLTGTVGCGALTSTGAVSGTGLSSSGTLSATGNATIGGTLTLGGTLLDYTLSGFTGTLAGTTVDITGSISYKILADRVTLRLQSAAITGTSNATGFTVLGLPSAVQPAAQRLCTCILEDNGVITGGWCSVTNSGVMTFGLGFANNTAGFTSTGTKGLPLGWQIVYDL